MLIESSHLFKKVSMGFKAILYFKYHLSILSEVNLRDRYGQIKPVLHLLITVLHLPVTVFKASQRTICFLYVAESKLNENSSRVAASCSIENSSLLLIRNLLLFPFLWYKNCFTVTLQTRFQVTLQQK